MKHYHIICNSAFEHELKQIKKLGKKTSENLKERLENLIFSQGEQTNKSLEEIRNALKYVNPAQLGLQSNQ